MTLKIPRIFFGVTQIRAHSKEKLFNFFSSILQSETKADYHRTFKIKMDYKDLLELELLHPANLTQYTVTTTSLKSPAVKVCSFFVLDTSVECAKHHLIIAVMLKTKMQVLIVIHTLRLHRQI